jgi:hypothetical protein
MTFSVDQAVGLSRPRRVTLFSLGVLVLGGGLNLLRAGWAWWQSQALADLVTPTAMPMGLLASTSLAWGLVFGLCGLGLWRLRPWGRKGALAAVSLFHAHVWLNHLLFDRSDYARQVWPFALAHTLAALLVVWGFLYWPAVRRLYAGPELEE